MKTYPIIWATIILIFSGPAFPSTASGGVIVFDNEAAFLMDAHVVSTENFDEFPNGSTLGIETVTIDGITYTTDAVNSRWNALGTGDFPPVSSPNALLGSDLGYFGMTTDTRVLTFGEGKSTDAIGFFISVSGRGLTSYRIVVTTTDGQQLIEPLVFQPTVSYRGFIAPEGIVSVAVEHFFPFSRANYGFDNVSRGAIVPEPASLTLLGIGLLAAVGYSRRRRGSAGRQRPLDDGHTRRDRRVSSP